MIFKFILGVILLFSGVFFIEWPAELPAVPEAQTPFATKALPISPKTPAVFINETKISVEVVNTPESIQKGLSGRLSLGADSGMLFVFKEARIYRFWMPDMYFPIDILWISQGKVADIDENVSNEFDPENPAFYSPSQPVQNVLEVNAGFVNRHGIKIGDDVNFAL